MSLRNDLEALAAQVRSRSDPEALRLRAFAARCLRAEARNPDAPRYREELRDVSPAELLWLADHLPMSLRWIAARAASCAASTPRMTFAPVGYAIPGKPTLWRLDGRRVESRLIGLHVMHAAVCAGGSPVDGRPYLKRQKAPDVALRCALKTATQAIRPESPTLAAALRFTTSRRGAVQYIGSARINTAQSFL